MSRFLARLATRITSGEKSFAPRPRHRFADATSMPAGGELPVHEAMTATSEVSDPDARSRSPRIHSFGTAKWPDSRANSQRTDELTGPAFEDSQQTPHDNSRRRRDQAWGERGEPGSRGLLLPLDLNTDGTARSDSAAVGAPEEGGRGSRKIFNTLHLSEGNGVPSLDIAETAQGQRSARAAGRAMSAVAHTSLADQSAATVYVHIGRIDVRALQSQAGTAPPAAPKSNLRRPSLHDYLHHRERTKS